MNAWQIVTETLKVVFLGIVEGITEWLPVSSTGHMILAEEFLHLTSMSVPFYNLFLYVIQLGAILAVLVLFRHKLWPFSKRGGEEHRRTTLRLWGMVLIGVLPAGVIGVLFDDLLEEHLFVPGVRAFVVAGALILYGILFIIVERMKRSDVPTVNDLSEITPLTALKIGIFQVLSIIPGTSRSGSTVLGARLLGVSRPVAAEFSFFMAIPIMVGVSLLKGAKFAVAAARGTEGYALAPLPIAMLLVGFVTAFLVSLVAIRFLMEFVRRHSFEGFGWYRIALGLLVLVYFLIV